MENAPVRIDTLGTVFDRKQTRHRWLRAFRELTGPDAEPTRRIVCRNWQMDHRVSNQREDAMLDSPHWDGEPNAGAWCARQGAYFRDALCRPASPHVPSDPRSAYLDDVNADNVVPRQALSPYDQLLHVASLNRLLGFLQKRRGAGAGGLVESFYELTGRDLPARSVGLGLDREAMRQAVDGIAEEVNRRGTAGRLAGALCEALGPTEPPWWAGFAEEPVTQLRQGDAAELCRALGMGHLREGEWLIVWRYEVSAVQPLSLCRPTVVEAHENPFHFPSPPGLRYGVTMPLRGDRRQACREVVHPPLRGTAAVDACEAAFLRIERPVVGYDEISELRRRHRQRLEEEHLEAAGWLSRHPDPS